MSRNTDAKYLELIYPKKGSTPIVLRYLQETETRGPHLPHVIFFTGFGEQRRASLAASVKPFVSKGFSVTSIAIPFDRHNLRSAAWLLDTGLNQAINKLRPPNRPVILAGVSRGAAIAAGVSANVASTYDGLVMISPLGLARLRGSTYIRKAINDHIRNKSFLDKEARKNAYAILGEMVNHLRSEDGLINALRFAMNQQYRVGQGLVNTATQKKLLAIFSGEQDRVFSTEQCRLALMDLLGEATHEVLHTIPGGHAATASKIGQGQLGLVADWLKTKY